MSSVKTDSEVQWGRTQHAALLRAGLRYVAPSGLAVELSQGTRPRKGRIVRHAQDRLWGAWLEWVPEVETRPRFISPLRRSYLLALSRRLRDRAKVFAEAIGIAIR